jgi:hypothetical protein
MNIVQREFEGLPLPLRKNLGLILGFAGLLFWLLAVHNAVYLNMDGYGLVSILGWTYFVGLVLVVVGFAVELMRAPLRSRRILFLIVLLILFLYGTAPAVEPVAQLTDSFIHAGFIQYILQNGHPLNGYDARFSWPGAFSLGAVLVAFTGQANAIGFLHWFPFFIELSYLAPLLVIARFSGVSRRAGWLGIAIYYSTNWIFQDYFSPQALNYLFYLVVIAAVLACWQPRRVKRDGPERGYWLERLSQSRGLVTHSRLTGGDTTSTWGRVETISVLGLLGLIALASALSHQLTPYAMVLALGGCLLTRRLGRPELMLLVAVFALGWLSLGASNYWVGHLNVIFGSVGQVSSTVSSNVTSRVSGGSTHLLVVEIRILLTGAVYLLAGVGFLRRYTDSRVLEALVGAPFVLVAAQSYGGEGLLRVVLFGLPFVSLLAASAVFPRQWGTIRSLAPKIAIGRFAGAGRIILRLVVVAVVLGFALATTIVRGGNDAYVSFSKGELEAVNYAYAHVRAGDTIGLTNYFLPIGQRDITTVLLFDAGAPSSYKKIAQQLLHAKPTLIILSQSEEAYGEDVVGYPVGWEATIETTLVNNGYQIAAHWTTATVLRATP